MSVIKQVAPRHQKFRTGGFKTPDMRAYEGSADGRRLGKWDAPALSPTRAVINELATLQRRARSIIRNNCWASRALRADVANEIGTGIIPRPTTPNKKFNRDLLELWDDYHPYADASGQLGAYGIQWGAARTRRESGEAFVQIIRKSSDPRLPVPLQFKLIESDLCPLSTNHLSYGGNKITGGVETNRKGRIVAYWFYPEHPLDGTINLNDLRRIKAEDIIHHFIPKRPGQLRGEPSGVQSMVRSYVFDKYDDAELTRKEGRAQFTGVIRRPEASAEDWKFDPFSGDALEKDNSDVPILEMETGTFPNLLPGEDITLFEGDDVGRGYKDYQRYQLLGISAGWDVPYQLVSGDYTEINDRLWRAIMNQYHREVEQYQELMVIPQLCRRMWNEFVDRAVLSGAVSAPSDFHLKRFSYIRAKHRPQAWKHIHPTQDVDATVKEIEAGLTSRGKEVDRRSGESVEEIDKQRSEDADRERKLKLNEESKNEQPTKTVKSSDS